VVEVVGETEENGGEKKKRNMVSWLCVEIRLYYIFNIYSMGDGVLCWSLRF